MVFCAGGLGLLWKSSLRSSSIFRSVQSHTVTAPTLSLFNTHLPTGLVPSWSSPIAHIQRRFAVVNLRPKKTKYRKAHKGFFKTRLGGSIRGTTVRLGEYGLQLFEPGRLKDKQLDTVRTMVNRILKSEKGSKLILRIFPHRPVTAKGAETRMGKGKGAVEYYATWVSEGVVIMEITGARKDVALKALNVAAQALPLRTRVVQRNPELIDAPRVVPYFVQKRLRDCEFNDYVTVTKALPLRDQPVSISQQ
ncbi:39S ribosomal protein L16, mitochondrial [Batrachochytrium dendrobatidis]